jgi:hypothetical protein
MRDGILRSTVPVFRGGHFPPRTFGEGFSA